MSHLDPGVEGSGGFLPQWQNSFPPPLAHYTDGCGGSAIELVQTKRDKFSDPKPAGVGHMQHGAVAQTERRRSIGGIQQRLDFLASQIRDQALIHLLQRNAVDLPALLDMEGLTIFEVAKERLDRRQAGIAGSRGIAAAFLDICQKRKHERGVDLSEIDLRRRDPQAFGSKPQQQHQAVGVRFACMRAGCAISWQILAKEGAEMAGQCGHASPPWCIASLAMAMPRMMMGVASRYQ